MIVLRKNETKLTCFNFVVGKGLTLVTLVGKPWKLRWNGCRVAKNEQKMKIFCKSNKRTYGVYEHIKNGQNAMLNFPTD